MESLYYFSVVTLAPLFMILLFVVLDYIDRKRRRAQTIGTNIEETINPSQNYKNALASFELLSQKEQRIFIGRILRDGLFKG